LHFFRVTAWEHEPRPLEDQDIRWQRIEAPDVAPMLPANAPVLAALALPAVMVVSSAGDSSIEAWIRGLESRLAHERLLVQVREKDFDRMRVQHLLSRILARTEPLGSRVVVNSGCGHFPQASGIHLTALDLMAARDKPAAALVGASCHDERELAHAAKLGLDYVVLGPVNATPSHRGARTLGWEGAARLAKDSPMPVYLIGGLTRASLPQAREAGAHGVALRSAAFSG
jgi:8-oxo-dGTP diphosphatase